LPPVDAEGGLGAIEGVSIVLHGDATLWWSVTWTVVLVTMIAGVVFARWRGRKRERPAKTGSLTELVLNHELRAQIKRLDEEGECVRAERDELLAVLSRLAELLEHVREDIASHLPCPTRVPRLIDTRDQPSKGLEDTGTLYPRRFWTASRLFILVALEDNGTLYPRRFSRTTGF
jgi:hypothetical protein